MAEAVRGAVRQAARARRIPPGARCVECGFPNPVALEPFGNLWRCYQCASLARGCAPSEAHHLLGKGLDAMTIPLERNLHRDLSDMQLDIPSDIRKRAPKNPLAFIIVILCAVRDFGRAILDYLSAAITWLQRLLEALESKFGKDWVKQLNLPSLFPTSTK